MSTPEQQAAPSAPKLSAQLMARGVDDSTWNTLKNSVYPGAQPDSILMAIDYCKARKLDVLKKPCHIVPMQVKMKSATGVVTVWRDVILPGIYEYRITAHRTGLYLGHTKPEYGPLVGPEGYEAPQWCDMTFFRWNAQAKEKVPFPVRVYYQEVVGLNNEGNVNARWSKAPIQMLTKCTEAAGLREAFPDEIGGEPTMEEMIGQIIDSTVSEQTPGATRTESAKDRLRAKLEQTKGATLDTMSGTIDQQAETVTQKSAIAEDHAREQVKLKTGVFWTVEQAKEAIRVARTKEELQKTWDTIQDQHAFAGVDEIPVDIEAPYTLKMETLEKPF